MLRYERARAISAAQSILDRGGLCVLEVCVDVPGQRWDARVLICNRDAEAVANIVAEQLAYDPDRDARLTGCDPRTLCPDPNMGAHLCFVAETPPPATVLAPPKRRQIATGRTIMLVREGMNPIVVTVGLHHTLREAARRMTASGVGAAVVIDSAGPRPGIITERDLLHANGVGQSIDAEFVREHLTSQVVYAAAEWPLEQAAAAMVRRGLRHVIVLDGVDVVGILSMRDIVRCWTTDGASCDIAR